MDGKSSGGFYIGAEELGESFRSEGNDIINENNEIIDKDEEKDIFNIDEDKKSEKESEKIPRVRINANANQADLKLLNMGGHVKASMAFTDVDKNFSEIGDDNFTEIDDPIEQMLNTGMKPEFLKSGEINTGVNNLNIINTDTRNVIEEEEYDIEGMNIHPDAFDDATFNDQYGNMHVPKENIQAALGPGAKDGVFFHDLSPYGKILYMMTYYPLKDKGADELLDLSHKMALLNSQASAENADPDIKKQLAVAGIEFHLKASELLGRIQKEEPERFNTNGHVAGLISAYNMNSNITVQAIEDVKGDIFPNLVENAFATATNSLETLQEEGGRENKAAFEDNLAKAMYFAKLKGEFDRVNGDEEQQKEWKAEILNEIFSDRFAANVEDFKKSDFFKRTIKKFENAEFRDEKLTAIDIKSRIDDTAIELAEEKYHDVYKYISLGIKDDKEAEDAGKKTAEIDDIKALANSIGEKEGEDPALKDFNNHPAFDTMYLRKRIGLYGKQENIAGELRQKKEDAKALEERIKATKKGFADEVVRKLEEKEQSFLAQGGVFNHLARIEDYNDRFVEIGSQMDAIDKSARSREEKDKLKKPLQDESYELVSRRAKEKEDMEKNYHIDFIRRSETEYHAFREEKKNLENLKKEAEEKAEQFVRDRIKDNEEYEQGVGKRSIQYEIDDYPKALQTNDTQRLESIKSSRYNRDNKYKKANVELYAPVTYKGQDTYVSRPSAEGRNNMENTFASYKQTYNVNNPELDAKFDQSIQNYDETEEKYLKSANAVRPDRSNLKIQTFVQEKKAEVGDIDLAGVEIENGVDFIHPNNMEANAEVPRYSAQQLAQLGFDGALKEDLASALSTVSEHMKNQKAFLGTDEYTGIVNGLKALSASIEQQGYTPQNMEKARLLNAQLNLYIARKNDEKDSVRNEKSTPKNRRLAAEAAQSTLRKVMTEMMKQTGEIQKDHPFEECAANLEAVMKLTGSKDRALNDILTGLKAKDYQASIQGMFSYLGRNANRYIDGRTGQYTFRLRENEEGGKKRLFPSNNGKIFKTVLLNFERINNAYMEHLAKTNPVKLPGHIFHSNHAGSDPAKGNSLNSLLHIQVNTERYETLSGDILPSNTITQHIQQFETRYKYLMHKASYNNEDLRIRTGRNYMPGNALSWKESRDMVDAALSVYYLKNLDTKLKAENKPFNLQEAEEERRKFISAVRKSSAYEEMTEQCTDFFDLSKIAKQNLHTENIELRSLVSNTDDFKEQVIIPTLAKEIGNELNEATELLSEPGQGKRARLNNNLDDAGYNLKVAKLLGITEEVEAKAQSKIHNTPLKGANFKDSLQKIGDEFTKSTVMQQEDATKGVQPIKM